MINIGILLSIGCFLVSLDPGISDCLGNITSVTYEALEVFFYSTNGPFWTWNYSLPTSTQWNFPAPYSYPCSNKWQGLICTDAGPGLCNLTTIQLDGYLLYGKIPPQIGNISSLQVFNIVDGALYGPIPSQFGQLTALYGLNVGGNFLTGRIPTELGFCSQLQNLYLDSNLLTGSVPSEIGQLKALDFIALSYNTLTGVIPSEIVNLQKLSGLYTYSNKFHGHILDWLVNITSINVLDFAENHFSGSIPTKIGKLTNLQYLYLENNNFTGTIPTGMGLLTPLVTLSIYSNYLIGTIPSELQYLTNANLLYLFDNMLNATIPSELALMSAMAYLGLNSNKLTGSLPPEFGHMSALVLLDVGYNGLTGSLSPALCESQTMQLFYASYNYLNGSLPNCLSNISTMVYFSIQENELTGTIPSSFGSWKFINEIVIVNNFLSKSIPFSLFDASSLGLLFLSNNRLTGTIPTQIEKVNHLQQIAFAGNFFQGAIPSQLGSLPLISCVLFGNLFTGTLPESLSKLTDLSLISLDENYLEGSIDVVMLPKVVSITLQNNFFSGSIPTSIGLMEAVESLDYTNNLLSGTIPSELGLCSNLNSILIAASCISGTLPTSLGSLHSLAILNMSDNLLTGSVETLFPRPPELHSLQNFDLSSNSLTGNIPLSLFTLPNLEVVLLYSNCFHGSLPDIICSSQSLTTLVLDTVTTSSACQFQLPSWLRLIIKVKFPYNLLTGSIPTCIWAMTSLQTLHLSGNGLHGTLGELSVDSGLQDVTLASNNLIGSIPLSFQEFGQFNQLDLSSNRFSGTLSSSFQLTSTSTTLDLTVNRLSGFIPNSIVNGADVNILDGNLFQCDKNSLPKADPNAQSYVCGSSNFDISLIISLVVLAVGVIGGLGYGNGLKQLGMHVPLLPASLDSSQQRLLPSYKSFVGMMVRINQMEAILVLFYVFVVLIVFSSIKSGYSASTYSTHMHQYSWIMTPAFIHGVCPMVLLSLFIIASLMLWILFSLNDFHSNVLIREASKIDLIEQPTISIFEHCSRKLARCHNWIWWRQAISVSITVIVHVGVMMVTNVSYVYATLTGLDGGVLFVVQISLGALKLLWNSVLLSWCLKKMPFLSASSRLQLGTFVHLFTFLIGPVLATFFTDTTCFQYVVTKEPSVDSSFQATDSTCTVYCPDDDQPCTFNCVIGQVTVSNVLVTPGWLYSYQCSSSILINYTPVLLYVYSISLVVATLTTLQLDPATQIRRLPSWIAKIVLREFYRMYHAVYQLEVGIDSGAAKSPISDTSLPVVDNLASGDKEERISGDMTSQLFHTSSILSSVIKNVTVLMTFGLACAPLSVLIAVDGMFNIISWKIAVSQYVNSTREDTEKRTACLELETACKSWYDGLQHAVLTSSVFCLLFWSIFLFDMIGDIYNALIAALTMLFEIILILLLLIAERYLLFRWKLGLATTRETVETVPEETRISANNPATTPSVVQSKSQLAFAMNEHFGNL